MTTDIDPTSPSTHLTFLRQALELSKSSPPKPTNFRVGAIIVSYPLPTQTVPHPTPSVLSTGYTLELPGNTHAEQCALANLASAHDVSEAELHTLLSPELNVTLYTTLEPCGKRLSGNLPCVQRIINTRKPISSSDETPSSATGTTTTTTSTSGIQRVIFGAKEPGTFVQDSASCRMLDEAGVPWEYVPGLEREILQVAMAGHEKQPGQQPRHGEGSTGKDGGTNVDDISEEERKRQEALPRNPKKRMMEVPTERG